MNCRVVLSVALLTSGSILLLGCAARYANEPLQTYDPQAGYRMGRLAVGDKNTDSTLVVVTFSGGGTRAAALAYGVLLGLRDVGLPAGSGAGSRSLLDEVDVISSVSGGSFTALAYGLWGQETFSGPFEQRFLRHNIQRELLLRGLNPLNLGANKSELAAAYYDEHVFQRATYQDLLDRGRRPFINVNAADMARQEQFQFTQQDFDMIGSDLTRLPVAWAAASSSAFPVLLDPVRYKYYHGPAMAAAVQEELSDERGLEHARHRSWAGNLIDPHAAPTDGQVQLNTADHRYLYLLDGGIIDNLGVMPFFHHLRNGAISRLIDAGKVDRIVVVLVDAGTNPPNTIERSARSPGGLASGVRTATSGIYTGTWMQKGVLNYLLLDAFPDIRRIAERCHPGQNLDLPGRYTVDYYVASIQFSNLTDEQRRQRFLTLPTSFALDDSDVTALIAVGQELVSTNPEVQRLVQDLKSKGG